MTSTDSTSTPARVRRAPRRFAALAALAAAVMFVAACEGPAIVFPVAGRNSFSDTFGAPRGGGRSHEGQDIFAPKGTPLLATVDGTITWMRWGTSPLSGNLLLLKSDSGWIYYYIHLNNDWPGTDNGFNIYDQAFADGITVGQRVKAGEVIGYLGDSGDAEPTSPHLHFEIRRPDNTVTNPYQNLLGARRVQRTDAERIADSPTGAVELFAWNPDGTVKVAGWAVDAYSNDPVRASVYVAGNLIATVPANQEKREMATLKPGRGLNHGFFFNAVTHRGGTPVPKGAEICVVAHSIAGGGSSRIGCSTAPK